MRIRRNASRLLGSASCQPWLYCPAPCPVDPSPPPPLLCHLNRSPWDVSPSPSEEPPSPDSPFLKFDGAITGRTHPLLEATATTAAAAAGGGAANVVQSAQKRDHKINGKKRKRHAKAMANDDVVEPMKMKHCRKGCNKSDGKGWHCKKPAQMPHSLCRYHLAQLRAYNAAYRVLGKGRRRTEGGTGSDFYYYSGFGPWRAKRRSTGGVELDVVKKESVHEGDDNDDFGDDHHGVYDDDDDDDNDEVGVGVGVSNGKRGRKKIKARSLKSLL